MGAEAEAAGSDKEDSDIENLFLKSKPVRMVISLSNSEPLNARKLSEKAETTYSHAVRVLNKMEKKELLRSERHGRNKNYSLTDKGKKIADGLSSTFESLGEKAEKLERKLD